MNPFHVPVKENEPSIGCYECFSLNHNTDDCNQKRKPDFFVPRIDQNLHSRFFQTLDIVEKYSVAFSSPSYLHFLKPTGIVVAQTIFTCVEDIGHGITITDGNTGLILKYADRDVLVLQQLKLNGELPAELDNLLASNALAIRCKRIHLENIINFPVKYLLKLISPMTKTLSCINVTFDSVIKFSEILSKIPNIQEFKVKETNIDFGNSWPHDWMKSEAGRSLMKLSMYLDNYDFDFGKLAEFMKSRMGTNFYIHLEIAHAEFTPSTLQETIDSHFVPYEINKSNQPVLNIIHIIHDHRNSLISTNLILSLP